MVLDRRIVGQNENGQDVDDCAAGEGPIKPADVARAKGPIKPAAYFLNQINDVSGTFVIKSSE